MSDGDPLVIFEFGAATIKLKPKKNNLNPTWNREIFIPVSLPCI